MPKLGKFQINRDPADFLEKELIGHCFVHRTSFICAKYLEEERRLQVVRSAAGWYLGCVSGLDDDIPGEPLSQDSQDYYETYELAQTALVDRTWTQRLDA